MKQKLSDAFHMGTIGVFIAVLDAIDVVRGSRSLHRLMNAFVPQYIIDLQPGAVWRRHKNGGGWVSSTTTVDITAYVGPSACVYDDAKVRDYARIKDRARVFDSALIVENARICDDARVMGTSVVGGRACVCRSAVLYDRWVGNDQLIMIGQVKPTWEAL